MTAALALAAAAAPAGWRIRLTPQGQAAARAIVLQRADLGGESGWQGGSTRPSLSSTPPCKTFRPKQSDLTLVGAAETDWHRTGLDVDSQANVLRTPTMVDLDWQRTVSAPQMLPCLRSLFERRASATVSLVSMTRLPFPRVARRSLVYRTVFDLRSHGQRARFLTDEIVLGQDRVEAILTITGPLAARATLRTAELALARLIVSRIRS